MLVADETNAELRLDGPAAPAPPAASDPAGAVVTVGSMSKAARAGLRLGWVRAAAPLVRELAATRADVDMSSPVLEQLLGVELLARWDDDAALEGVLVTPGPSFSVDGTFEHHLRLPFTAPPAELEAAVRTLARIAARLDAGGAGAPEAPAMAV